MTFIWCIIILWIKANAKRTLIVEFPVTRESKFRRNQYSCVGVTLTTNLTLYLLIMPSGLNFFLKIHLHPTCLQFWRYISENPCIALRYEFNLTINGFFLERRFRRVHYFLKRARITFNKIVKKSFPKFFCSTLYLGQLVEQN